MAGETTTGEKRIRWLEGQVEALRAALASLGHRAGQTAEDDARQTPDDGAAGRVLFRMQSVGVIPAASGAALGMGTARFLQVISGTRYLTQPFADGDVTADTVNDTGFATVDNEYLICAYVDGLCTALVGDCATATPTRAGDPPT